MKKTLKNNSIIWDYDLEKIDINDPQNKIWFLSRKLRFGDFSDITKRDLKDNLPKLNIDPSLKELLTNYLHASN